MIGLSGNPTQRGTLRVSNTLQEGKRRSNHHRTMDENSFKIVDIHVIPSTESREVCLLAVTATGCRLYFGQRSALDYNQRQADAVLSGPSLLHVRIPPTFDSAPEGILGAQGQYQIHQSLYSNGVFLAAHGLTDAADALVASAPDSGPINKASTATKVPLQRFFCSLACQLSSDTVLTYYFFLLLDCWEHLHPKNVGDGYDLGCRRENLGYG